MRRDREIIFYLLKRGEHGVAIVGDGLVVDGAIVLDCGAAESGVKEILRERRAHGPQDAWPSEPGGGRKALKTGGGGDGDRRG